MKKRILPLLLCLLLLAGCGNTPVDVYVPTGDALAPEDSPLNATTAPDKDNSQSLCLIYYKDRTMNPYSCTDYTNRALFSLIYQGLFTVDRQYRTHPILCSRFTMSEDMYRYTFYVDENATFSDGTPVTPQDVAASLNAARESDVYSGRLFYVSDIEVEEDGGVSIYLYHPYEDLPLLLDIPIVKASQVLDDHPLGTGPYTLVSTVNGGRLNRRTDWWCQADLPLDYPYITLLQAESPAQIRDEFQFRDLSIACTDPGSGLYADYLSDYELWDCENGGFLYLVCKSTSKVFASESLRAALTYAIDRNLLVDSYYRGHARAATLPASPASPYYNSALASRYAYDPEKFASAVSNAGMRGAEVTLLVNSDDSVRLQVAKEIAKMLTAGGLQVKLLALGSSAFHETLNFGEYDLYLGMTQLSANMDLSQFFYTWGSQNYGGIADDALFAQALECLANSGNYHNFHRQVMESGAICPILFRSYAIYATRGVISDLQPARDAIFFYTTGKSTDDILSD